MWWCFLHWRYTKQIGKEDKLKISRSYSENGKFNNYNFISKDIVSKNTNFSEC